MEGRALTVPPRPSASVLPSRSQTLLCAAGSVPIEGGVVELVVAGYSDGGVLVLAEIERQLGIAERLARCIEDPRAPDRVGARAR